MIESFKGGSGKAKNMIDIQFQQSATQDKTSMFFIMVIASLFYITIAFATLKLYMPLIRNTKLGGKTKTKANFKRSS